jgi:predicted enzyme related to lactoylglutathione lyase
MTDVKPDPYKEDPNYAHKYAKAPPLPDGTRNQNPAEGKLKGTTLRIKRALVFVTDLKRSIDFYENVIGLEVYAVDQVYSLDQTTMGNKLFNTVDGTRRRIAQLNTSNETRGIALREVDTPFEVPQNPRVTTVLFEASDILGIAERATAYGSEVIGPILAQKEAVKEAVDDGEVKTPRLRYMELGVVDPDGHVIAFFKYYEDNAADDAEWNDAAERHRVEVEL